MPGTTSPATEATMADFMRLVLPAMLPAIYVTAKAWHRSKMRKPHAASLVLVFLGVAFAWEFMTRPW